MLASFSIHAVSRSLDDWTLREVRVLALEIQSNPSYPCSTFSPVLGIVLLQRASNQSNSYTPYACVHAISEDAKRRGRGQTSVYRSVAAMRLL